MVNKVSSTLFYTNSGAINSFFIKIVKFGLVGFSGLLIDFGTTYFFKEKLNSNKYLANAFGFCIAVISNFR